jgi:hypothetical protein
MRYRAYPRAWPGKLLSGHGASGGESSRLRPCVDRWRDRDKRAGRRRRNGDQRVGHPTCRGLACVVLLGDPEARYTDLGTDYYETRMITRRQARNHVKGLERLGYRVTIENLTPDNNSPP